MKQPHLPGTGTSRTSKPGKLNRSGRVYFSRQTEQRIFFYLTVAMLAAGAICRLV